MSGEPIETLKERMAYHYRAATRLQQEIADREADEARVFLAQALRGSAVSVLDGGPLTPLLNTVLQSFTIAREQGLT